MLLIAMYKRDGQHLKFGLFVCFLFSMFCTVSLGTVDEVDEKAKTSRFTVFDFYLSYRDTCSGCSNYWCYPFLVVA